MRTFTKSLLFIATLGTLSACGGGGSIERDGTSSTGTTTETGTEQSETIEYTVSVALQNGNAESDKNLTQNNSLTAIVQVLDQNGNPKADTLITFTLSNDELANFSNDTGTASTNENGEARIGLSVGSASGDGQLTATTADGEVGTTTFSSSGTAQESEQPASLNLYTDKVQLPSSGSDSAQLIALVKNAQSVLMEGQSVSFSAPADSGVEIQVDQAQTDASGRALATLTTKNNAENRTITVIATVGNQTKTLDVEIAGTEVTINGSQSVTLDVPVIYTLRVQNSDGVAIPNQRIEVEAGSGVLDSDVIITGDDGQATLTYRGEVSGSDIIRASSLNAETIFDIVVQPDDFSFTGFPEADIPLDSSETLTVSWMKDGEPFVGGEVSFSASRGTITSDTATTTNSEGKASFSIESDNAGVAAITATGIDNLGAQVSTRFEIEFIATQPETVQADATPDILGPDGQKSTITAIVRDRNGNLVKNAIVSFNVDDISTGFIAPSQATTDSNGVASTVFTSGAVTSEDDVIVTTTVNGDTGISDEVVLTVGNRPFDIVIGTGNSIESVDVSTYLKELAVFVTDSAGRPIANEELTVSATPVKFLQPLSAREGSFWKGGWVWNDESSLYEVIRLRCPNEDFDGNGNLDLGEDRNNDEMLTPGIVGSVRFKGPAVTDENGQATIEYRYPKEYGAFTEIEIAVFSRSSRSENSAYTRFILPVALDDRSTEGASPPSSPFGSNLDGDFVGSTHTACNNAN